MVGPAFAAPHFPSPEKCGCLAGPAALARGAPARQAVSRQAREPVFHGVDTGGTTPSSLRLWPQNDPRRQEEQTVGSTFGPTAFAAFSARHEPTRTRLEPKRQRHTPTRSKSPRPPSENLPLALTNTHNELAVNPEWTAVPACLEDPPEGLAECTRRAGARPPGSGRVLPGVLAAEVRSFRTGGAAAMSQE